MHPWKVDAIQKSGLPKRLVDSTNSAEETVFCYS